MNFGVVILGSDINPYYMARCFNDEYNIKPHLICKQYMGITGLSNILTYEVEPKLNEKYAFLEVLKNYSLKNKHKKLILIPGNDEYTKLIVENTEYLKEYYYFNVCSEEILNSFLSKNKFYETYKNKLDLPKTYIFTCGKEKIDLKNISYFMYPLILKPCNAVNYFKNEFPGQAKVFKIESEEELLEIIKRIEKSGYREEIIIQEFIPGDDSLLFDSMFYVGTDKKAKLMSFAQIGLQEHTKEGVGNCTVLVNGYNEFNNTDIIKYKLKDFLEEIGYQGYCEVDLKFDRRDNKFKVFEINARQARCGYYLTACGYNMAKYLVDDLIYKKEQTFTFIKEKHVLTFVPKTVIKKYVTSTPLREEILSLASQNKITNPLKNPKEKNLHRKIWLILRDINYIKKYTKKDWWSNK